MIDWAAARLDYVSHHDLTYADIAAKYHAAEGSVWNRAAEERWTEQRKTASEELLEKVRKKITYSQSEQLAACNACHLEIAEKFDSAVKQRLERETELSESQLRHLMSVAEGAQRIARLALGASTENVHSDPYSQMTDQELAAELSRLGVDSSEPAVQ